MNKIESHGLKGENYGYNKTELPSREVLDILSYKTSLKTSIKQLSLRRVDVNIIMQDIVEYSYFARSKDEFLFLKNKRLKSMQSAFIKYNKCMEGTGCKVAQCFNDILGIRIFLVDYPDIFLDYFRVVDLRQGKKVDDAYRPIELYIYTIKNMDTTIPLKYNYGVEKI